MKFYSILCTALLSVTAQAIFAADQESPPDPVGWRTCLDQVQVQKKPQKFTFSNADIVKSSKLRDLVFAWSPSKARECDVQLVSRRELKRRLAGVVRNSREAELKKQAAKNDAHQKAVTARVLSTQAAPAAKVVRLLRPELDVEVIAQAPQMALVSQIDHSEVIRLLLQNGHMNGDLPNKDGAEAVDGAFTVATEDVRKILPTVDEKEYKSN